jgi:hypothetical protein
MDDGREDTTRSCQLARLPVGKKSLRAPCCISDSQIQGLSGRRRWESRHRRSDRILLRHGSSTPYRRYDDEMIVPLTGRLASVQCQLANINSAASRVQRQGGLILRSPEYARSKVIWWVCMGQGVAVTDRHGNRCGDGGNGGRTPAAARSGAPTPSKKSCGAVAGSGKMQLQQVHH